MLHTASLPGDWYEYGYCKGTAQNTQLAGYYSGVWRRGRIGDRSISQACAGRPAASLILADQRHTFPPISELFSSPTCPLVCRTIAGCLTSRRMMTAAFSGTRSGEMAIRQPPTWHYRHKVSQDRVWPHPDCESHGNLCGCKPRRPHGWRGTGTPQPHLVLRASLPHGATCL